jgi:succinyl-CoA synthetase alpha subunit
MREAGVTVVEGPHLLGKAMKDVLSKPRPKAKAPAVAASPAASKRASGPARPVKKAKAGRA